MSLDFNRLTDRARKVFQIANQVAQEEQSSEIDSGVILVAIMREGDGVAANILKNLGLTLEKTEKSLLRHNLGRDWQKNNYGAYLTEDIQWAIDYAYHSGCNHVGTEHLLLGISRGSLGTVVPNFLKDNGIDFDKIKNAINTGSIWKNTPKCPVCNGELANGWWCKRCENTINNRKLFAQEFPPCSPPPEWVCQLGISFLEYLIKVIK